MADAMSIVQMDERSVGPFVAVPVGGLGPVDPSTTDESHAIDETEPGRFEPSGI
jgi:hypothetical protein